MSNQASQVETLFIIGSHSPDASQDLLSETISSGTTSVVLIQDAVTGFNVPAYSVQVLKEDLDARGATSPFSQITYDGLLEQIFEAKRVIVL